MKPRHWFLVFIAYVTLVFGMYHVVFSDMDFAIKAMTGWFFFLLVIAPPVAVLWVCEVRNEKEKR